MTVIIPSEEFPPLPRKSRVWAFLGNPSVKEDGDARRGARERSRDDRE